MLKYIKYEYLQYFFKIDDTKNTKCIKEKDKKNYTFEFLLFHLFFSDWLSVLKFTVYCNTVNLFNYLRQPSYGFTQYVPKPIHYVIHYVSWCFVCRMPIPSVGNRNKESWRFLVKEPIAKIAII